MLRLPLTSMKISVMNMLKPRAALSSSKMSPQKYPIAQPTRATCTVFVKKLKKL